MLFDFQGGSVVLEKGEKNERDKIKKKVEESEMISNIFDDANLGNVANEPGSDITILMNLQHELMY